MKTAREKKGGGEGGRFFLACLPEHRGIKKGEKKGRGKVVLNLFFLGKCKRKGREKKTTSEGRGRNFSSPRIKKREGESQSPKTCEKEKKKKKKRGGKGKRGSIAPQ